MFPRFIALALITLLVGCQNFLPKPTPLLIQDLLSLNEQTHSLFIACSQEATYTPEKEGCDPRLLELKLKETREAARVFIAADITQPHGYDIFLETTLIYFRISLRNENEYSEAERIARQFFEIQKASSGRALDLARFYWAAMTSEYAAWQFQNTPEALDVSRKQDVLLCASEAKLLLKKTDDPLLKGRLLGYIQLLLLIAGM